MSYKLYSPQRFSEKNIGQWADRSLRSELDALSGRLILSALKRLLPPAPARCLEAGCGLGTFAQLLHYQGYEAVGVELEPETVRSAREQAPGLTIILGNVLNLPFPAGCFDVYLSLGVIEHFEEGPERVLAEAARVLKKDGIAIITVPYLSPLRRFVIHPLRSLYALSRNVTGQITKFWEYRYTRTEMKQFLCQTGFRILETSVDDYDNTTRDHHIGLSTDLFFLRDDQAGPYKLNKLGGLVLRMSRFLSPWLIAGGVLIVASKKPDGTGTGMLSES
jgi:SAM-dependent methyltransferase